MDRKSNGFTLIEVIVVIALIGIIAVIAVPRLTGFKNMAEESVCDANRRTLERMYSAFLLKNDHEDNMFNQFIIENFDEVCPAGGVITNDDGKLKCSLHEDRSENDVDDWPGDEVPWI